VANTAIGAVSFLALEAIGGSLVVNYGFTNAVWAIAAVSVLIFLTGLPISYYAARYGVDMDLLTRGAGFGYIGSTITSLIYAASPSSSSRSKRPSWRSRSAVFPCRWRSPTS
jgi:cellobiose-specific phosphotransferase system component IIC